MSERILIVAPSWIGDAILSEPLVALLRDPYEDPIVDVLAPAVVRAGLRAHARHPAAIIENPFGARQVRPGGERKPRARTAQAKAIRARSCCPIRGSPRWFPSSRASRSRIGYVGEARYGLLTDARRLDKKAAAAGRPLCRAGASGPARSCRCRRRPCSCPTPPIARPRCARCSSRPTGQSSILCPGAEFGPAKRWPPNHFADLAARRSCATALQVWLVGSPNDKLAAEAVLKAAGDSAPRCATSPGAPTSARRSTSCRSASLVVSNDSGLMHAAAAVGVPLVALFGSSSPVYTPPLSPLRRSPRSTSRAAPASSANARSAISNACAISSRASSTISRSMVLLAEPGDGQPVSDP